MVQTSNPIFDSEDMQQNSTPVKIAVGSRVEVLRPEALRKKNVKSASHVCHLKAGDVLVVDDRANGNDGVERVQARVDMNARCLLFAAPPCPPCATRLDLGTSGLSRT